LKDDIGEHDGVEAHGVESVVVEGDVEDGVEPHDEEEEGRASVKLKGVEGDVKDGGGVDIGEHHGVVEGDEEEEEGRVDVEPEGVEGHVEDDGSEVEEYQKEEEGRGGQGIGATIHEDMECDHDGGHVS